MVISKTLNCCSPQPQERAPPRSVPSKTLNCCSPQPQERAPPRSVLSKTLNCCFPQAQERAPLVSVLSKTLNCCKGGNPSFAGDRTLEPAGGLHTLPGQCDVLQATEDPRCDPTRLVLAAVPQVKDIDGRPFPSVLLRPGAREQPTGRVRPGFRQSLVDQRIR